MSAPMERFDLCDVSCTVDCGHCKGQPIEAMRAEIRRLRRHARAWRALANGWRSRAEGARMDGS